MNPLSSFTEEVEAQQDLNKEVEQNSKSEEGDDPFRIPNTTQLSKSRANSEKSVNQKKLLTNNVSSDANTNTQTASGKFKFNNSNISLVVKSKVSIIEEGVVKDGKSIDNTNASVQNNDNEHNVSDKEIPVEPVADTHVLEMENVNFDPNSDHDELFLKQQEVIQEDEDYQMNNYMSHPHKEEPSKVDDLHYVMHLPDNDFEMDLSESLEDFGNNKPAHIEVFNDQGLNLNELQVDGHSFEHHSGFLQDDFIGSPRYYD